MITTATITTILAIILFSTIFIFGWSYCTTYTPTGIDENNPHGTGAINKEIAWWFKFYTTQFIMKNHPGLAPLLKPLHGCEVCMASVYGTIAFWTVMPFSLQMLALWPFVIVMIAGLNRIVKMIMQH